MANSSGTGRLRSSSLFSRWEQRLANLPLPEVEDSVLLRVLVQALVVVGIIATDITAVEATDWQVTSFWAVPASLIGATWSWHRRRKHNIATKFCLAIGMLLTLALFFGRIITELNDTRLALAQLLIQLQVLHSFDLPRRKDLGYSMVIGLILLGVAATLSQTLTFAPILIVFAAIALPVLVLDYRSRLGLIFQGFKLKGADLAPKRLGLFLLVIVSLGLVIFAFLPRLPGYQLRTLPVSAPVQYQGNFDNRTIINPGYVRRGRQNTRNGSGTGLDQEDGTGQGRGQGRGAGELDKTYYYGFNQQINQNLRGELEPQVVMRVRSQAEGFWRAMAFDRYTGQGWEISRNDKTRTLKRPFWTYQFYIAWPLLNLSRTREVVQTYTAVAEIPSVIPALTQPREVYFPTEEIALDPEDGLRSPVNLSEGFTYSVISQVPYRDRSLLAKASTKFSRTAREVYLQIPSEIAPRVRRETERILAKSPKPLTSHYEKALYLTQYLKQNYTLPRQALDLPFLSEQEDLVEAFLFKYEQGYPDHFSTVLTVMLRSIGIPARLVTGFGSGQFNPFTGLYVVRNTDAYAMTEVLFPRYGWFTFDPIPGHELFPPSIEDYQTFTILERFWKWVAGWLPSPLTGLLNRIFGALVTWVMQTIGWLLGLFSRGWVGLFLGLLVGIGCGFLGWLSWVAWRYWRYGRWLAKLPPMEGLYQQMLRWLEHQGLRKQRSQTPLEYARQLQTQQAPAQTEIIDQISLAYVQWRYGGRKPDLSNLRQQFQRLKKQHAQNWLSQVQQRWQRR